MDEGLMWIGCLVVLGAFVRILAQGIRTSGLKRLGWFVEFHNEEKPPKPPNK